MNSPGIQRDYDKLADVLVVEPRLLRHFIKEQLFERGHVITGTVPHARLCVLARSELERFAKGMDFSAQGELPRVIVVSSPILPGRTTATLQERDEFVRRAILHGKVHLLLEERTSDGNLDARTVRRRIDALGRTEFEEIRSILEHDDLLLPPGGDREVYVEFAALFLELYFFAPELLIPTFPGIEDPDEVLAVLGRDLDLGRLRERSVKERSPQVALAQMAGSPSVRPASEPRPRSVRAARRDAKRAMQASRRGRDARVAVFSFRATLSPAEDVTREAEEAFEQAIRRLAIRIRRTLGLVAAESSDEQQSEASWREALTQLSARAGAAAKPTSAAEFAVLESLERACVAFERPGFVVDVPSAILSWGKQPILRPRTATPTLAVKRHIEVACARSELLPQNRREHARLDALLGAARKSADKRVRDALGPQIERTLESAGLEALTGPESQGRDNLTAELLDQILERGFISLAQLRDAVSRNDLKLPDLRSFRELYRGDPLLLSDERLSRVLDGTYRRGDIYVRWLQKLTSLSFGTASGRVLSLWLLLPVLGAFAVTEGMRLVVGPVAQWFGGGGWTFSWGFFLGVALFIIGVLHSDWVRLGARSGLEGLGWILALVFLRIPRALLGGELLSRVLGRAGFRTFVRMIIVPGVPSLVTYFATPFESELGWARWAAAGGTFLVVALTMRSRVGYWLEEFYLQHVAPAWATFSRHLLPSLFRAIGRAFAVATDALDRASHQIGDALRFRATASRVGVFTAGAAGLVWAILAYVLRLYVTLLIEPEINPVKHFPVVTVAHKLMLPFLPDLLVAIERPLSLLGPIVGKTIAGVTVFFLPSVFGFLAWEFKENYRLYRTTRATFIQPSRFGPSGENCRELLVPGIHSGTLPKVYDRLRRAARREAEGQPGRAPSPVRADGTRTETGRFYQRLRTIRLSLRRLVERQLLPPLRVSPRATLTDLELEKVELSSNRIRLQLASSRYSRSGPLEITIEQLGGFLLASLSRRGFIDALGEEERLLLENVLCVFYQRAHVDLVREQIQAELGRLSDYEVSAEGLIVRSAAVSGELVYPLQTRLKKAIKPRAHGEKVDSAPILRSERLLLKQQPVAFSAWEAAWRASMSEGEPLPRLTLGASLLGGTYRR